MEQLPEEQKDAWRKMKEHGKEVQQEVRERTISLLIGGFGLVAAIAWNDAVKALIEYLFPLEKNSLTAKFIYAIVMTAVLVIVTLVFMKWLRKKEPPTS